MNKYKLVKCYPGSPVLGYVLDNTHGFVDAIHPEKYPEFWERVEERDYDILSFKGNVSGEIYKLDIKGNYKRLPYSSPLNLSYCLKQNYSINSVKRLTDGEIFTVGDKVRLNFNKKSISKTINKIAIEKIGVCPEQLFIYTDGEQSTINNYVKANEPLFKTEDDVDIYEGDRFWFVAGGFTGNSPGSLIADKGVQTQFAEARFSTKEAAEEYLIMNKPCLSVNDFITILRSPGTSIIDPLIDLVKNKIK